MSDPHPTLRFVERGGAPVLEVGGTWTAFTLHDLRQRLDKARRAGPGRAAAKGPHTVDATHVERLDTTGALEILQLAGGPKAEVETAEKDHAQLFDVVKANMVEPAAPRHVDFL